MSLIVVTGGIGCGKSTVLRDFKACGGAILDADEIAHTLYKPASPLLQRIAEEFGQEILTPEGALNRPALARRVFTDAKALEQLNNIVHPAVFDVIWCQAEQCGSHQLLFAAIPLWYECLQANTLLKADAVIATWCCQDTQHKRLRLRGWSDDEITNRLSTQISANDKAARADYVIISDCTWEQLTLQCKKIYQKLSTLNES